MKFDLKEDQLMTEIEQLDTQINDLGKLIIQDESQLEKNLEILIEDEKRLESELKIANKELKNAVNSYYDKKRIHNSINTILNYTREEFQKKFNSEIFPFRKNQAGKFEPTEINISILMEYTLTDIVRNSSWKHESKKLKFFEYVKILYYFLGGFSMLIFIDNENLNGIFLYLSFFITFLIFSYALFSIFRINFYGKGTVNSFYEKFFKNNVESVYNEEIIFLDSVKTLDKELKKII